MLQVGCELAVNGYRCRASVLVDDPPVPSQDVTGLATWSTSDPTIATITSVGFLTVSRIGEVSVRATYQDLEGFEIFRAEPGGMSYYHRALSGWVRDARDNTTIAGVSVQVLDGPNTGRTVTTGSDGAYQMYELQPGTFRVRFSRAGYVTTERPVALPGDTLVSLDATLARSAP
jgi:hypothetical protein